MGFGLANRAKPQGPSGELPAFIRVEFEYYMRCGTLCHGFAHVSCPRSTMSYSSALLQEMGDLSTVCQPSDGRERQCLPRARRFVEYDQVPSCLAPATPPQQIATGRTEDEGPRLFAKPLPSHFLPYVPRHR